MKFDLQTGEVMDPDQFYDQETFGCYIDGKFITEGKNTELISPVSRKRWKDIIPAKKEDTKNAIEAAERAFHSWKSVPAPTRGKYLRKIGDIIVENQNIFAEIMAMEMGKPIREGVAEAHYAAGYFYWFAGEAERIYGQTIPSQFEEKTLMVNQEPIGVCVAITPWNFPIGIAARKIAPALAAGCTMICKPSPECPISMLLMAYVTLQIDLPPGVFNVVIGPEEEIGELLLKSPVVRKVSFTGSCKVGRYIYQRSADTLKKLTLELGGHAPAIIFDDADLDKAIKGIMAAKFRNNGQTCVSPNRIYVQEHIYDTFKEKLAKEVELLRIGSPLDQETVVSNVLHPSSQEKVKRHLADAIEKGAKPFLQSKEPYSPTILCNITSDMQLNSEETFGPLIPLIKFKSENEAIILANASEYGLASYVFTENLSRARKVMRELNYGIIGINDGVPSTPQVPFGGVKNSGFGREGGPSGIHEYLTEKYVSIGA